MLIWLYCCPVESAADLVGVDPLFLQNDVFSVDEPHHKEGLKWNACFSFNPKAEYKLLHKVE